MKYVLKENFCFEKRAKKKENSKMSTYRVDVQEVYIIPTIVTLTKEQEKLPLEEKLNLIKELAIEERHNGNGENPIYFYDIEEKYWSTAKVS